MVMVEIGSDGMVRRGEGSGRDEKLEKLLWEK